MRITLQFTSEDDEVGARLLAAHRSQETVDVAGVPFCVRIMHERIGASRLEIDAELVPTTGARHAHRESS